MLFDFDRYERERLAREAVAAGSRDRTLLGRGSLSLVLALVAVLGVGLWWMLLHASLWHNAPPAPTISMHVAEVTPTDSSFGEPVRVVSGKTAYWRVAIHDSTGRPLAGALVQVDVLAADGAVRAQPVTTTNTDGLALFRYALPGDVESRVYTIRVVNVFNTLHPGAVYDAVANAATSSSFSVNTPAPSGSPHAPDSSGS
jgi:hypothetical protein